MKKIQLKNGYVKYPDKWVAVKNMNPAECRYCGAVQVRNGNKYELPTFLFFLNKPIGEMNKEDENKINNAIIEHHPIFQKVINDHVEEVRDEKDQIVNLKEWNEAPTIGYFPIPEHDKIGFHVGADIYRD